jgi:hypothetical protein
LRGDSPIVLDATVAAAHNRDRRPAVTFIEQLFGISPDAGSGSLEALLLVAPVCVIVWITLRSYRKIQEEA